MSTTRIFSRRLLGLDTRVWRLMIILMLLSLILLSYRITTTEKCIPFTIGVDKNSHADTFFFTGETIRFFSSVISEEISWDFNDKTTGIAKGSSVLHAFYEEGVYFVTARKDLGCEFGKLIYVKEKPVNDNLVTVATGDKIVGVASTVVGKIEQFISPVLADDYEWEVLKHPEMGIKNGEKASFTFNAPGTYTLQLTLDHDRVKSFTKRLLVQDLSNNIFLPQNAKALHIEKKLEQLEHQAVEAQGAETVQPDTSTSTPPPPPPVVLEPSAPRIVRIADETFKGLLQKLVAGEVLENEFDKYLCRGGSTAVVINGDRNNAKTFSTFFREYKGRRERSSILGRRRLITIKSVKLIKDESDSRCINTIEVTH